MNDSPIKVKDLVLIGGGHAHVHVLKMFGMDSLLGVQITLITRDIETPYSGMLPGYIAGMYTKDECHIDLGKLCSFANARLFHVEAVGLNTTDKLIYCKDGRPPVRYDLLSIDIGICPKYIPSQPISIVNAVNTSTITPVKPIDSFSYRWELILNRVIAATVPLNIAIIGGGGGGTELAFSIHHRLKTELFKRGKDISACITLSILQRGRTLMPEHNRNVQHIIHRLLSEKCIEIHCNTEITDVRTDDTSNRSYLLSQDGRKFYYDEAIWCTQAVAQSWLKDAGIETTENGFVCVRETLESVNTNDVFACGDVAHLVDNPRPKAGVFAVRAGPPLTSNLRKRLLGCIDLDPWKPQSEFLGIIGTGDGYAVASKGPMGIEGEFLWKLKDRIDRNWMSSYTNLPVMGSTTTSTTTTSDQLSINGKKILNYDAMTSAMGHETIRMLSKAKMRCGGCGSKVGSQLLTRSLKRINHLSCKRPEVYAGIGHNLSDDAALVVPPPPPYLMVQTIDYFRSFISDPYLFGQIAANHALSDVHAMNGEAVTALALCTLPYGPERLVEEHLVHMLAGAMVTLRSDNCSLVGGHTAEGADLAFGLTVNGIVHPDHVLRKGPALMKHSIIITKAIGTGTIMAANMRVQAKGVWVSEAIKSMTQSNAKAAKILKAFDCSACTDVTGFGLMGHLLEMLQFGDNDDSSDGDSSDDAVKKCPPAAMINLSSIPLLLGAADCVRDGVLSSLHPENIRCSRAIGNVHIGEGSVSYPLLFDPQTAGGLLATVPPVHVDEVIKQLHEQGYVNACVIGEITERSRADYAPLVMLDR